MTIQGEGGPLVPLTGVLPSFDRLTQLAYTAPELMRLSGMTRKQVDYWDRIGLVRPTLHDPRALPGRPSRFYSAAQLVKALIVCELRRGGFSLRQVDQVARNLEEHGIALNESQAYLLTDGYSVYYAFSDDQVVDVMKHHRQRLLLVPIHDHVARLREVA